MVNGSHSTALGNRTSILKLMIFFIVVTTAMFWAMNVFILLPRVDKSFQDSRIQADDFAARVIATNLEQYIFDRELALRDLASHPLVTNVSLMGDHENPAFQDLIIHSNLLGEDPDITLIDAFGTKLYSESDNSQSYDWVLPLLREPGHPSIVLINPDGAGFFEIAVPVIYGAGAEAVLVAKISASPEFLFHVSDTFSSQFAVAYAINDVTITSDLSVIEIPRAYDVVISRYGINFTYFSEFKDVEASKKQVSDSFVVAITTGAAIMLLVLFFFGRRIIVKPFQDLANSEKTIASAVEGISRIGTNGQYITINKAFAEMTGYSVAELIDVSWNSMIVEEDRAIIRKAFEQMRAGSRSLIESKWLRKDGSFFHARLTLINSEDSNDGFYCFMQDVTAEKVAEDQVRKNREELQLIFDNVPVRIWFKDDKNRIIRLNYQAAKAMGGKVKDFEGEDTYDLFPEMAKKYHQDDLAVINSGEPLLDIIEEFTPKDGPRGWVSTDKIPYVDPQTGESFLFVCSQDITAIKQVELEKSQLIEQLSYTNEELGQFVYIASHDLKSPLRGIAQLSQWIQEDCNEVLPEESRSHLALMESRVSRMESLLDDLLKYSRASNIQPVVEVIDLKTALENLLDLHVDAFGFDSRVTAASGAIQIAREPFEIVIRNLLDNAVKHHPGENGVIEIAFRNDEENEAYVFEVSDNGNGIAPKHQDKVFKMFQTLKSRDEFESSGMGLAIVKKLVQRHGGKISIESDGISGALFRIVWPWKLKE